MNFLRRILNPLTTFWKNFVVVFVLILLGLVNFTILLIIFFIFLIYYLVSSPRRKSPLHNHHLLPYQNNHHNNYFHWWHPPNFHIRRMFAYFYFCNLYFISSFHFQIYYSFISTHPVDGLNFEVFSIHRIYFVCIDRTTKEYMLSFYFLTILKCIIEKI